jgi:hypothetical protein
MNTIYSGKKVEETSESLTERLEEEGRKKEGL